MYVQYAHSRKKVRIYLYFFKKNIKSYCRWRTHWLKYDFFNWIFFKYNDTKKLLISLFFKYKTLKKSLYILIILIFCSFLCIWFGEIKDQRISFRLKCIAKCMIEYGPLIGKWFWTFFLFVLFSLFIIRINYLNDFGENILWIDNRDIKSVWQTILIDAF